MSHNGRVNINDNKRIIICKPNYLNRMSYIHQQYYLMITNYSYLSKLIDSNESEFPTNLQ